MSSIATIIHVSGDITKIHHRYHVGAVVQQLNCLTTKPHGISETISRAWPWSDVYGARTAAANNFADMNTRGVPGEIVIKFPPTYQTDRSGQVGKLPAMVGIYGQFDCGKPLQFDRLYRFNKDIANGYVLPPPDIKANRVTWFLKGLRALAKWVQDEGILSVAFPSHIGCGLAGGEWKLYENLITKDFARRIPVGCIVYIVDYVRESIPHEVSIVMTGSRFWTQSVCTYFDEFLTHFPHLQSAGDKILLSHGGCRGADKMCAKEAQKRGWQLKEYAADWNKWEALGNVKAAGVERNQEMIDGAQPQFAFVFIIPDSTGTWDAFVKLHKYANITDTFEALLLVIQHSDGHLTSQIYTREQFLKLQMKKHNFFPDATSIIDKKLHVKTTTNSNSIQVKDTTPSILTFFNRKRSFDEIPVIAAVKRSKIE